MTTPIEDAKRARAIRSALDLYARRLRSDGQHEAASFVDSIATSCDILRQSHQRRDTSRPTRHAGVVMTEQDLYSLPQVAAKTALSRKTIEREIADGKLKTVKVRGTTRVDKRDLEVYLDCLRADPSQVHTKGNGR